MWLKTTLKAVSGGTFKCWDTHSAKVTWLVNTRESASQPGSAQSKLLCCIGGDRAPVVQDTPEKKVYLIVPQAITKPLMGLLLHKDLGVLGR